MPLFIATPRNDTSKHPYATHLNVLSRKQTAVQRALRRGGLANYEPLLQATLFSLCDSSNHRPVFYDVGSHIGLYSALDGLDFAVERAEFCEFICQRGQGDATVGLVAVARANERVIADAVHQVGPL